ncbi:MAG: hypothetical protein VW405_01590 [Rhodospirillaceae bacterium]
MSGYYSNRYAGQYTPLLESQRRMQQRRPGGRSQDQQLAGWQRAAADYSPAVGTALGTAAGGIIGGVAGNVPGAVAGAGIGGGIGGAIGQAASSLFGTMADDTMSEHDQYEQERQARMEAIRSLLPYL